MRVSLVAVIFAMAALGLVLAVVTGRIYRDHSLNSEKLELANQLTAASRSTQQRTVGETILIARLLREQYPDIGKGIGPKKGELQASLRQFSRLYDGLGPNPVVIELGVYDREGVPVARYQAEQLDVAESNNWREQCKSIWSRLTPKTPEPNFSTSSGRCIVGDRVYDVVFVAMDDSAATVLGMASDAVLNLMTMERGMATPIRISMAGESVMGDSVIYESPNWPSRGREASFLFASQFVEILGAGGLVVEAARDYSTLSERLDQTRYAVFFAAAAISLLVVLIALAFVEKVAISPLRSIIHQMRQTQRDESQLGKLVTVSGNAEIQELAGSFNNMTARLERLYENIDRVAFTDSLTQLPSRGLMLDRLEQAVVQARTDSRTLAFFMMDLDRFKEINDTLGHRVGDLLLQQVAIRLRSKLRESDFIARMGGDEFAVLMPNVTPKQADMAARMLLQSLRAPFVIESQQLDIHTGIGIVLYPDHGVDAQTLIQRADVAMYAAKQGGTGYMFYDPQMDRHHPALLTLLGELRQAVEQEQFVLYYQPKIGLKSNRVIGVEALVRWRHPSGKLIMPDTFISILEQTGMIRSLTGWVTNEALRMARELRHRGIDLPIAVNISTRDLLNSGLSEDLIEQLAAHQASAQSLELEITESAVMSDVNGAMQLLTQLAGMGLRLVIDDFGTGYSSLAYLKRLPVHAVKIDKSFVIGMAKDENDAAIVYTSIDLAHNLGLQVIAEGVDQESTLARLRSHGCDAAQGIFLSRPLPAEDLIEWLEKSSWGLRAEIAS